MFNDPTDQYTRKFTKFGPNMVGKGVLSCHMTSLDYGTVILQIFGVVLFPEVIGFTEIKKTPKWEKYIA